MCHCHFLSNSNTHDGENFIRHVRRSDLIIVIYFLQRFLYLPCWMPCKLSPLLAYANARCRSCLLSCIDNGRATGPWIPSTMTAACFSCGSLKSPTDVEKYACLSPKLCRETLIARHDIPVKINVQTGMSCFV